MKKIILILLVFVITQNIKAQTIHVNSISDTSKYLRDSIIPKTNYYVGKPLSILLKDLKVKVKAYLVQTPNRIPDTLKFNETTLEFNTISIVSTHILNGIKTPNIHIKFATPILIPKLYFKQGYFLENCDWDSRKEAFFGNCIIASIEIRGLSPNKPPIFPNLLDTVQHH